MLSLGAYAGEGVGSSGGGAGIVCKDPESGPTTITVLDYYESLRNGVGPQGWIAGGPLFETGPYKNIFTIEGRKLVINHDFLGQLTSALHYYPSLRSEIEKKAEEIGTPDDWTPAILELQKDVDLGIKIPRGCKLMQLALRVDGHFFINPLYLPELSQSQISILQLHEAVYALAAEKTKLYSAAPIRFFFKSLYQAAMMFDDSPGYNLVVQSVGSRASILFDTIYLSQDDLRELLLGSDIAESREAGNVYDSTKLALIKNKFQSLLNNYRLSRRDRETVQSLLKNL